jgi:hypothetical protein
MRMMGWATRWANGECAVHHQVRAVPERGRTDELADQADAFMREAGQRAGAEGGRDVGGELVVPASGELRFERTGLDGLHAGDGFDQQRLVLSAAGELLVQAFAQDGHDHQGQANVQRQAGQHDQRQRHAVEEHNAEEDDREDEVEHQRERVAGEEAADVLQLAHARHRVSRAAGLEVCQRQGQQVTKQLGAEFDVDAAGGVAEDVSAQRIQHALEDDDDQEADDEHVERGHAAVDEHLVHHRLEKQWADEREELQEQGDQQHFAEQLAVFDESRHEPGEVEPREFAGE